MAIPRTLHRLVRASAANVPVLRGDVVACLAAAGIGEDLRWSVALAVTEACGNVVRHAYRGSPGEDDTVEVQLQVEDEHVRVVVADSGAGFDAPSPDPGLGLGLLLMRQSADVAIDSSDRGTTVRMTFPRTDAADGR